MLSEKNVSFPEHGYESCFQIEDKSFWFRKRNEVILHVVHKLKKNGNFADVGGGNGFVASFLQDKLTGSKILLVEPGAVGCQNAKRRGVKEVFNKTLQELEEYHSLDNIGLFDVVEHIQDDGVFLKDIHKKLSPDGKVFITVPAYNFLWSKEDVIAGHFRRYSIKTISERLKTAGFEVEYASGFFITLIPLVFFLRSLPFRMKIGQNDKFDSESHNDSFLSRCLEKILSIEIWIISKGIKLSFGASLIVCARKR